MVFEWRESENGDEKKISSNLCVVFSMVLSVIRDLGEEVVPAVAFECRLFGWVRWDSGAFDERLPGPIQKAVPGREHRLGPLNPNFQLA
jgi:hypothetical protein